MIAKLTNKFMRMLERAGLDDRLVKKAIQPRNRVIGDKVVGVIRNHGFKPNASQEQARKIMGKNFFGIEEAIKHFGVKPTRRQLEVLSEIPFTPALLQFKRRTHILVAKFPLSIIGIRHSVDAKFFHHQNWFNHEHFADEQGKVSWELVRRSSVNKSFALPWCEQKELLGENDKAPSANLMVYTIIGYWLSTGRRLFKTSYVRTSSVRLGGKRVYIGYTLEGLRIHYGWEDSHKSYIGIATARKSFH